MTEDALFDGEFLKKLEYLHIVSKRVFAGQFRAERRARQRGSGLEFADHRAYAAGDDFRHVDWKAYQRLDKLLLRLFEEEQDLPIYLFVDASRSMAAGRPSKLQYARQVAAALCYIGLAQLDRVTLMSYGAHLGRTLGPQRGKGQILKVFRFLTDLVPEGETNAYDAFNTFCARRRTRGVVVIVSDFLDPHGFEGSLNVLRFAQHDVFAVHVMNGADTAPEFRGDLQLVDAETGQSRSLAITTSLLTAYRHTFEAHAQELASYCSKYHFGYLRAPTETAFEDAVLQVFRQGRFLA